MSKKLILLSGKINCGKNQYSEYLKEDFEKAGFSVGLDLFARDLKDYSASDFETLGKLLRAKVDTIKAYINTQYDAKLDVGLGDTLNKINELLEEFTFKEENFYEDKTDITRVLLQTYGTEIGRRRFDDKVWVKKAAERFNNSDEDVIIVTDVRFPNEIDDMYDMVSERDVISVRIEREIPRDVLIQMHESENALDDYERWFYIVDNNGTLQDLRDSSVNVVNSIIASDDLEFYLGTDGFLHEIPEDEE